jgi:hypothetical protein
MGKNGLRFCNGVILKDTYQAIADFGKAATLLHTLIHKSARLTKVQVEFIKTEMHTLETALRVHYPKKPGQD